MYRTRPQFTHDSLLRTVRQTFGDHCEKPSTAYPISTADCLMSALAMFSLKYPSLLQFDRERREEIICHNLRTLYGIDKIPCDTQMRERLDGLPLFLVREVITTIVSILQRSKVLELWKFLDQYYLVSLDGTGFFSSPEIHCDQCCEKHHKKDGSITYHHQMVVGCLVHPTMKQVIPLEFEPIVKEDGSQKNDCERNASKRFLKNLRHYHPQLPVVLLGDGLSSNAPFIREARDRRCSYIFVCKEADHKALSEYFWAGEMPDVTDFTETVRTLKKRYRFMKDVPLNDSNPDLLVTVVFYEETDPKGSKRQWMWVTDLEVTHDTVRNIALGGRARWKIENETFNTLKNQGYNYEHNYGHGYKTLSNLFAGLMLLAFLIDQCLEAFSFEFKAALKKCVSRTLLWKKIQAFFVCYLVDDWNKIYGAILDPPKHKL